MLLSTWNNTTRNVGKLAALGIILVFLGSVKLRAEEGDIPKTGLSLGVRGAYYKAKDADDGDWFGGAQVRIRPLQVLAIEGSADYRRSKFPGTTVHTYPVQASLLIFLIPARISPFILGGAGWYYTTVEGPGNYDHTQNRFGTHAGGGVEIWLNEHLSLDSTYRYIWLEKLNTRDAALQDKDFEDSGHMITAALNIHF